MEGWKDGWMAKWKSWLWMGRCFEFVGKPNNPNKRPWNFPPLFLFVSGTRTFLAEIDLANTKTPQEEEL